VNQLVAIDLPGGDEFVTALTRAWADGDAALPLDQRLSPDTRRVIATQLGASMVVSADGTSNLDSGRAVEEGDALVVATSGTTGTPKGVVLTHAAVRASALLSARAIGQNSDDRWLACLPVAHVGGLSVVTRSLVTGAPFSILPGFDVDAVMRESERCTLVSLVATALRRIDPSRFRRILLGGGRPPIDRPPNAVATYGLTETGSGVVYDGVPFDGVSISIQEDGEILIKSPTNMRCYRDGSTSIDADGWLHTGDVGAVDANGVLTVRGRRGDMINTGGEKVWPDAVEAIVHEIDPDSEHVVIGIDDEEWGQMVVLVTTARELTLDTVRSVIRERIAPYAAPKRLIRVESIPRTAIGKVRRADLERMVGDS